MRLGRNEKMILLKSLQINGRFYKDIEEGECRTLYGLSSHKFNYISEACYNQAHLKLRRKGLLQNDNLTDLGKEIATKMYNETVEYINLWQPFVKELKNKNPSAVNSYSTKTIHPTINSFEAKAVIPGINSFEAKAVIPGINGFEAKAVGVNAKASSAGQSENE